MNLNETLIQNKTNHDKQEQSNRNEPQTNKNRNTTYPASTEQILTQEEKINFENLKRIRDEKDFLNITKKHT